MDLWKRRSSRNPEAAARQGDPADDLRNSDQERELAALMRGAQEGDAAAYRTLLEELERLAQRYVRRAFGLRRGMDASRCEDVVQEILLGVHAKRHTHDPVQFFLPWFYAIARYKVIDEIRRIVAARKNDSLDDELEVAAPWTDLTAALDVEDLLSTLPEKQRTLLKLVKLEGLSVEETSGRTGYSESDVKVSIHRALKALRKRTAAGEP
jgi:RNA polymerase sigma-70 factor (ECF subfamily)